MGLLPESQVLVVYPELKNVNYPNHVYKKSGPTILYTNKNLQPTVFWKNKTVNTFIDQYHDKKPLKTRTLWLVNTTD